MTGSKLMYAWCRDVVVSGEGGRTTPDPDIQDAPETDPISQALAALEKRLAIELKVL